MIKYLHQISFKTKQKYLLGKKIASFCFRTIHRDKYFVGWYGILPAKYHLFTFLALPLASKNSAPFSDHGNGLKNKFDWQKKSENAENSQKIHGSTRIWTRNSRTWTVCYDHWAMEPDDFTMQFPDLNADFMKQKKILMMKNHGASHRANTPLLTTMFGNIKKLKTFWFTQLHLAYSGVGGELTVKVAAILQPPFSHV